jgi:GTPase SAR1 family protein
MKEKSTSSLSDITGYEFIGHDYVVTGNGDISFFFEVSLPGIFSIETYEYNDLNKKLSHYISGQKDDVVFHKLDLSFIDKEEWSDYTRSYTGRKDLDHFLGRPILKHKCFLVVSYPTIVGDYWPTHSSTSFIQAKQLIKDDLFRKIENASSDIRKEITALASELSSNEHFKCRKLEKQEITDVIFNIMNASFDDWQENLDEDIAFNPIEVGDGFLRVGSEYVGVVSFAREAARFTSYKNVEVMDTKVFETGVNFNNKFGIATSIGYAINIGTPIKHIVHTIIQPRSKVSIEARLKHWKNTFSMNFLSGIGSSDAKNKQVEVALYLDSMSFYKGCTFSQSVWVYDIDRSALSLRTKQIVSQYRNVGTGVESFVENMQAANLYFSTMPGVARENFMYHFSTVPRAVAYMPLETHLESDSNGFTYRDRFGNKVVIDFRKNKYATNPNKGIFGESGTGKSVLLNSYFTQALDQGYHLIVLDVGGSFKSTCELNNGRYIDCGQKSNLSFNIFETNRNDNGEFIYRQFTDDGTGVNKIGFIYIIIAQIVYGDKRELLETNERIRLFEKSIEEYYKYTNNKIASGDPGKMSFTQYVKFFNEHHRNNNQLYSKHIDLNDFNLLVEPYLEGGEKAFLLNGAKSFDIMKDRFVVFDTKAIKDDKEISNIVSTIIIEIVERKVVELPLNVPKCFTMDEAVDFLIMPKMGEFIGGMYRKIRKSGGEAILATQDAKFLKSCETLVKDAILSNMEYKIILGLPSEDSVKEAKILMGITDKEIALIKTLIPKREFFLKIKNHRMILRNELSPHTLAAFTTDADEWEIINQFKAEYEDTATAIDAYVESKTKQ